MPVAGSLRLVPLLLLAPVLLAGCAVPDAQPRFERRAVGGMCSEGPCSSVLTVEPDGSWTLRTQASEESGELSILQRQRLDSAYVALPRAVTASPAVVCPDASDGQTITYSWESEGVTGSASSCDPALSPDDPLLELLDELAESPQS